MDEFKKHILVIEDEDLFRDIVRDELSRVGYKVSIASNGEEAIEKLKTIKPDLVLLDIVMPKKDGFTVLSEMKNSQELKDIPVIVLSNSGDVVELDWARKLGALEVLIKADFGPKDLVSRVKKMFEKLDSKEVSPTPPLKDNTGEKSEMTIDDRLRVLLVEDEPDLQNLLEVKLKNENLTVYTAGTGGEAILKARELKPDLILLDLILPDIQGFEVLTKLKEEDVTKGIPVIVLSNLGQQGDVKKAIDMGAKDYLIKAHHTPEQIFNKIRELVEN